LALFLHYTAASVTYTHSLHDALPIFLTQHVAFDGNEMHHPHHQKRHQKAWHHTAQKKRTNRSTRHQGVNHHGNGGRDDGTQCGRSEEHTSELQSRVDLVCRLLLEKKK